MCLDQSNEKIHADLELGAAPCEEECAQVGTPDYPEASRRECQRYIARLRAVMGVEPDGVAFRIQSQAHDFGTYLEVVIRYDPENEIAADYAWLCEKVGPTKWGDE